MGLTVTKDLVSLELASPTFMHWRVPGLCPGQRSGGPAGGADGTTAGRTTAWGCTAGLGCGGGAVRCLH